MPLYRWEDYQCTNFGHCQNADAGRIIDLPRGAEPFCPTCAKPILPLRARAIVPVSLPGVAQLTPGKSSLRLWRLVCGALVALALSGGLAWLLSPVPKRLRLETPERVSARVGDPLEVALRVRPVSARDLAFSVEGPLPAGVALGVAGRRLYGTPQTAGYALLVITARAPRHASASATMGILVEPKPAAAVALSVQVPAEVEGRVGQALEVEVAVEPLTVPEPGLRVVGKLPPGVRWDAAGKRLLGIPRHPGSYAVVLQASAPDYAPGLAALRFTIGEAQPALEPPSSAAPVVGPQPSAAPLESNEAIAQSQPDRSRVDPPRTRASRRLHHRRQATRNGR